MPDSSGPLLSARRRAVARTVSRAFAHIRDGLPSLDDVPDEFYQPFMVTPEMCHVIPRFLRGLPLTCVQESWFGFYVARAATRSVLQATNHLAAAISAHENGLYAPSIVGSYNAAFLALHGFLALEGRVLVPGTAGFDEDERDRLAVLTRGGRWVFEYRDRKHTSRWLEVERTIVETGGNGDLPGYFEPLFLFLCEPVYDHTVPLEEKLQDPESFLLPMRRRIADVLKAIPQVRHAAAYQSMGVPVTYLDAIYFRDIEEPYFGILSEYMLTFTHAWTADVAGRCEALLLDASWSDSSSAYFASSCLSPWFDPPHVERITGAPAGATIHALWSRVERAVKGWTTPQPKG
jgi:hypothetical protein